MPKIYVYVPCDGGDCNWPETFIVGNHNEQGEPELETYWDWGHSLSLTPNRQSPIRLGLCSWKAGYPNAIGGEYLWYRESAYASVYSLFFFIGGGSEASTSYLRYRLLRCQNGKIRDITYEAVDKIPFEYTTCPLPDKEYIHDDQLWIEGCYEWIFSEPDCSIETRTFGPCSDLFSYIPDGEFPQLLDWSPYEGDEDEERCTRETNFYTQPNTAVDFVDTKYGYNCSDGDQYVSFVTHSEEQDEDGNTIWVDRYTINFQLAYQNGEAAGEEVIPLHATIIPEVGVIGGEAEIPDEDLGVEIRTWLQGANRQQEWKEKTLQTKTVGPLPRRRGCPDNKVGEVKINIDAFKGDFIN
jgi:hypothetical protein